MRRSSVVTGAGGVRVLRRPAGGVGVAAHDQVVVEPVAAQRAAAVEQRADLGQVEAGAGEPGRARDLVEPQRGERVAQRGRRRRGADDRAPSVVDAARRAVQSRPSRIIGHRARRLPPSARAYRWRDDGGLSGGAARAGAALRRRHGHAAHGARTHRRRFRRRAVPRLQRGARADAPRRRCARFTQAYLAAGADVVETDTFTASRLKLDEYGLGDKTLRDQPPRRASSRATPATQFRRRERPRFVAGSMGPTGMLISSSDPSLSKITFERAGAISTASRRARSSRAASICCCSRRCRICSS